MVAIPKYSSIRLYCATDTYTLHRKAMYIRIQSLTDRCPIALPGSHNAFGASETGVKVQCAFSRNPQKASGAH